MEMGDEAAKQLLHPVGEAIKKSPCFSLMAALHVGSDAAGVSAASVSGCDALQWIACDSAKPGRSSFRIMPPSQRFHGRLLPQSACTKRGLCWSMLDSTLQPLQVYQFWYTAAGCL